ncbi:glycoside hydrolase family 127 protein [Metabacillus litoralis]|uniref:glycoside hydrolase family 127 protein n=1 Tax=Metabacillus litoralis TaxID=152268 RepID=UPI00203FEF74|nr:glycoside hydrolase family 127 protein [Metabacillus litoralis]MCM3164172.1 glycoside hydrolase family 127 protein [Metabacillus litoralis]
MSNVKLLDGIFKDSEKIGKEFLLTLDVDRLVASCYVAASLTPKKPRYGGWETMGISGHSIGHWLSATATMYSVTRDEKLKEKLDYAVDELAYVQSQDPFGYVSGFPRDCYDRVFAGGDFEVSHFSLGNSWVPWYSIHKIYAGLIDVYNICHHEKALEVVLKLANWAKKGTDNLTDEEFQRMLICEHGGMNEAMADLYLITGNKDYLDLAIRFCHNAILDPLSKGIDELEGKHANTQIPKVIGAAKLYEITGETYYRDGSLFFWEQVTENRSYVIGGNSKNEHFGIENSEELGITTTETCNTYNMMKLTEHLFKWTKQSKYMDYYEKALYNHILASQDPETGMKTYFVSTQPGHFKVYCSHDDSFWCCTGTGMENPARYTRSIYHQVENKLFVNLFIASEINLVDKNILIKQETKFPEAPTSKLTIVGAKDELLTFQIRVPYWISGELTATINGQQTISRADTGYLEISGRWNDGDVIELLIPMNLHSYKSKDEETKLAFMYGPIVLAGALGTEKFPESDILDDHLKLNNHPLIDVPTLVTGEKDLTKVIKPLEGSSLCFETEAIGQPGNLKMTLIPFYALHHQRYTLYWDVMDNEKYVEFLNKEQSETEKLESITIDAVQPNEQQPEVDHAIKTVNSHSGYLNLVHRGWRDSRDEGYFSYELAVDPKQEMYLHITYFGGDRVLHLDGKVYERDFHILIDGTELVRQTLKGEKSDKLFAVVYPIPFSLTEGKEKIEVKFVSTEGKIAGGIYGLRMINHPL